jgi:hypothetical protein
MATDDLITSVRAKQNPALASVDSAYLAILISAASTQIQRWCNRCFVSQEFTDKRDGEGYQTLFLPNFPVTAIKQVDFIRADAEVVSVMPNGGDVTKFFFIGDGGEIDFIQNNPSDFIIFPEGFKNISIIYTGGFSPVPEDVQEACAEQVVFLVQQSKAQSSIASKKLGDWQETYFNAGSKINLSATAFQILASYRRMLV